MKSSIYYQRLITTNGFLVLIICDSEMADKVRKKPPFFTLKRWNSQKQNDEHNGRTPTPQIQNSTQFFKPNLSQTRTPSTPAMDAKPRK